MTLEFIVSVPSFIFKISFIYFQAEEKGGRKRKRNISVWLPLAHPQLGTWPKTHTCALTGNRIGDHLVCRLCSIHGVTSARAVTLLLMPCLMCKTLHKCVRTHRIFNGHPVYFKDRSRNKIHQKEIFITHGSCQYSKLP